MTTFMFGSGDFYGVPLNDADGNAIVNPTPVKIGTLQEMSLEFSGDLKELYGQNQFAVAVARGKTKVSGKVKGASLNGKALNSMFFGQSLTNGSLLAVHNDTNGSPIPGQTPYTLTVAPPGSGIWNTDLGVIDETGNTMTRVASAPESGKYSVSDGVYTFAQADAGKSVFVNYCYSATSSHSSHIAVKNMAMGAAPSFKAYMQTTYQGKSALVVLYAAISSKLQMFGTKLDDFSIPEFDFSGQSDAANNVADIYIME